MKVRVHGTPQQQGSKNQFGAESNAAKLKPWRGHVSQVVGEAWGDSPALLGPVGVVVEFTFPRPKSHFRTGKNAHLLRDDAPLYKQGKPDADKLQRAIGDSLTGVVMRDDAQIVHWNVQKTYGDKRTPTSRSSTYQEDAMTQDELMLLEKGRIPAAPILERLAKHVAIYDTERNPEETGELTLVCERAGLDFSTIARNLYRYTHEGDIRSLDFDTADKLLCCGMRRRWSEDDTLTAYYERVDLSWHKCGCPGCEVMFQRLDQPVVCRSCGTSEKKIVARGLCAACTMHHKYHGTLEQFPRLGRGGGRQSEYCSKACREAHARMKSGASLSGVRMKVRSSHCRKGHKMTPENTKIRPNGKRECRTCHRAGARASYHRTKGKVAVAA
jgi:Holliday junction resolvase RusA-like endonuclease